MRTEAPVLQRIHDTVDVYPRGRHADHSVITRAKIVSSPNGYRITTYPGGLVSGYDGLILDVTSPGGIWGKNGPTRVETSRDFGGLISLDTRVEVLPDTDLPVGVVVNGSSFPKREGLYLPGDPNFELFTSLHQELQALYPLFRKVFSSIRSKIQPELIKYDDRSGIYQVDLKQNLVTDRRARIITAQDNRGRRAHVELDYVGVYPRGQELPDDDYQYFGKATVTYGRANRLSYVKPKTIDACKELNDKVKELYS